MFNIIWWSTCGYPTDLCRWVGVLDLRVVMKFSCIFHHVCVILLEENICEILDDDYDGGVFWNKRIEQW